MRQLQEEAELILQDEPELSTLLHRTILAAGVVSFEDAVASTIAYRLLLQPCRTVMNQNNHHNHNHHQLHQQHCENNNHNNIDIMSTSTSTAVFSPDSLRDIIRSTMDSPELEMGHTFQEALREDVKAVCQRDPATETALEVVLFCKGFAALVCHRAAYRLWYNNNNNGRRGRKKFTALFLQSQASAVFGLDIHPASRIGKGVMLDHGTGVVVGETATIGDGCTILHGVTLGGTGKDQGDRHPKVGKDVLIGAGASLLGNIKIGDGAKIGAGSVVLRDIPKCATAVGIPAKIIGRAAEPNPGSEMDITLKTVNLLHKKQPQSPSHVVPVVLASSSEHNQHAQQQQQQQQQQPAIPSLKKKKNENTKMTTPSSLKKRTYPQNNGPEKEEEEEKEPAAMVVHKIAVSRSESNSSTTEDGIDNAYDDPDFDRTSSFREYMHLSKYAPPNSITILTLRDILKPYGCNGEEIGNCFYDLDTRNVGYFAPKVLQTDRAIEVILEHTQLDRETIQYALHTYYLEYSMQKRLPPTTIVSSGGAIVLNPAVTVEVTGCDLDDDSNTDSDI